jgi:uncharacterized protein
MTFPFMAAESEKRQRGEQSALSFAAREPDGRERALPRQGHIVAPMEPRLNDPGPQVRTAEPASGRRSIAFGAERLVLIVLKAPAATLLLALVLALLAALGIERIRIDDSLAQLFRSDDLAFKQFEQVSREFPSSEYDVLIVVSGQSLLARESVEKLRDFVTDVQLIDGTRGALSMFSAREPAPQGGMPQPLFPDPLPKGSAYHRG